MGIIGSRYRCYTTDCPGCGAALAVLRHGQDPSPDELLEIRRGLAKSGIPVFEEPSGESECPRCGQRSY